MKKNVGTSDRIIRLVVAVIIGILFLTQTITFSSTIGVILAVVGVIFLFTSAVSWCAIYQLVGASTCPTESTA